MTANMAAVLRVVNATNAAGRWHRAEHPGQRVTLAALYRCGKLTRRVWRSGKNSADDAHEYANPSFTRLHQAP